MWNQDLYQRAIAFAAHAHRNQLVPDTDYSYVVHLANVAAEIAQAQSVEDIGDSDLAIQCALLHDVLEDTDTSEAEVDAEFGSKVLRGIRALTKNHDLPKAQRMRDSLERIKKEGREVACVKLADRITNLQPPPISWDADKKKAYLEEAKTILSELGYASIFLSDRLSVKIGDYKKYL